MSLDLLPRRKTQRYGWTPDLPDHRDRIFNVEESLTRSTVTLPLKFTINGMPAIFDQSALGSCTANGIVAVLMDAGMKQGEAELMLSRLFVYYGERVIEGTTEEDSGAQIRDGIKVIAKLGAPPETEWPYNIARFAEKPPAKAFTDAVKHEALTYQRVIPGGPGSPIRTPLVQGFPIVFGFSVPEIFEDPAWDPASEYLPLPRPSEGYIGGHCTVIVGWDFSLQRFNRPVFRIRNSWGLAWGEEGHFHMDARYVWDRYRNLTSDFWIVKRAS